MAYKETNSSGAVITQTIPAQTLSFGGSLARASDLTMDLEYQPFHISFSSRNNSPGVVAAIYFSAQAGGANASREYDYTFSELYSIPLNGHITLSSFTIEKRYEIIPSSATVPWYNAVPDQIPQTTKREYWYLPPGQSVSATFDLGSFGSVTASGVTSPSTGGSGEWTGKCNASIVGHPVVGDGYNSYKNDLTLSFIAAGSLTGANVSDTAPNGESASASVSPGTLHIINQTAGPVSGNYYPSGAMGASASVVSSPDIPVSASYKIFAQDAPYPDTLTVQANVSGENPSQLITGASGNASTTQKFWTSQAAVTGGNHSGLPSASLGYSENNLGPVSLAITTASLLAQGEDYVTPGAGIDSAPRITRLAFRGRTWPGLTVSQAQLFPLIDANCVWSAVGAATLSGASGAAVTITGTGAAGDGANLSIAPALSCLPYRYLRIVLSASSKPCTITIPGPANPLDPAEYADEGGTLSGGGSGAAGTKTWNLTTGGTWDLDLCCPDLVNGAPASGSDYGSRWPTPSAMGDNQGVWRADQIQVRITGGAGAVQVQSIGLRWQNAPTWDALDRWERGRLRDAGAGGFSMDAEWSGGETRPSATNGSGSVSTYYDRRGFASFVDGKQGVEESVFWYSKFEGGGSGVTSYNFNTVSIDTLASTLELHYDHAILRYPGVTASASTLAPSTAYVPAYSGDCPPDTYYLCSTGPAAWLINQNNNVGSTGSFVARDLFDVITPCSGTDWGSIEAFAILRGTVQGLALDQSTRKSKSGYTLSVFDDNTVPPMAGMTVQGSGTSDSTGFYSTGSPAARGPNHPNHLKSTEASPIVNLALPSLPARYRQRISILAHVPSGGSDPWIFCRNDGAVFLSFTGSDGSINVWKSKQTPRSMADWSQQVIALPSGSWKESRITGDPSQRLYVVATSTASGNGLYKSTSDDDGATWSTPVVAIPSATHGTIGINQHDTRIIAGYVAGAINATLQQGNGAVSGVYPFLDAAGANMAVVDGQFHIGQAHEGADRWLMVVVITGESAVSTWSSTDLHTWKREA